MGQLHYDMMMRMNYNITTRVGGKGYDPELTASYHLGTAMIDKACREEAAEELWRECRCFYISRHCFFLSC